MPILLPIACSWREGTGANEACPLGCFSEQRKIHGDIEFAMQAGSQT
jgi:hypothetical protein